MMRSMEGRVKNVIFRGFKPLFQKLRRPRNGIKESTVGKEKRSI